MTRPEGSDLPSSIVAPRKPQKSPPNRAPQREPAEPGEAEVTPADPAPGSGGLGHRLRGIEEHAKSGVAAGARAVSTLGDAAESLHLEVVATGLKGDRALAGHILGTHLVLAARGLHGPRETPAVVYLFADALAVRPSDDAPMSTVPVFGLHMVFPPLAVTRWLYKAGRIGHANVDLVEVTRKFEAAIGDWTVDDFAGTDPKLQVYRFDSFTGAVHVYQRLGFAHLSLPVPGGRPVRLKSTLPSSAEAFTNMWDLCNALHWPHGLTMEEPHGEGEPSPQ